MRAVIVLLATLVAGDERPAKKRMPGMAGSPFGGGGGRNGGRGGFFGGKGPRPTFEEMAAVGVEYLVFRSRTSAARGGRHAGALA